MNTDEKPKKSGNVRSDIDSTSQGRVSRLNEDGSQTKAVFMNLAGTDVLN